MIDHMSISVTNFDRSRDFYLKALQPLGYEVVMEFSRDQIPDLPVERVAGLGANRKPDFWLQPAPQVTTSHIAFGCTSRTMVDAFYEAAVAAGGKPNGAPGPRPQYHANYYGAFVLDPDGYNVEAVCHLPE